MENTVIYSCDDCGAEFSEEEHKNLSDMFCPECKGTLLPIDRPVLSSIACPNCGEINDSWKSECLKCESSLVTSTKQCANCGQRIFPWEMKCSSCGKKKDDEEKKQSETKLVSCRSCSYMISERAEFCPQCGTSPNQSCVVCKEKISTSAKLCPKCGDPEPFKQLDGQSKNGATINLLRECTNCSQKISLRASNCPVCKNSTKSICNICNHFISLLEETCPNCGDPNPFNKVREDKSIKQEQTPISNVKENDFIINEKKISQKNMGINGITLKQKVRPIWLRLLFMIPAYAILAVIVALLKELFPQNMFRLVAVVSCFLVFFMGWNWTKYKK